MGSIPRMPDQMCDISDSTVLRDAINSVPRLDRSCAGAGSALRSNFPFSVNGSASRTTKAEGIM